jgi:hypothetical protein
MTQFPVSPKVKRPLWQTLLAPMLLASLGLHGLFLLIPVASSDEAAIPPPDPEQDNIAITRIPPAAADTSPSTPSPVATAVPQVVPQRAPIAATRQGTPTNLAAGQPQSVPNRTGGRSSRTPSSRTPSPRANQAELPRLSEQGTAADDSATARVSPPRPGVPTPQPTIPALSQNRQETLLAYVASLDLPEERLNQLAATLWQRYGYSSLNTRREDATENLEVWQDTIQQETGLTDLIPQEDHTANLSVEIERRVCLTKPPGDIKLGLLVNPDGSLRQEPALLRSSGYDELNQKAIDLIHQYAPQRSDEIKAYTVTVDTAVDYGPNDCLQSPQQPSATSAET